MSEIERAWDWREKRGVFEGNEAVRVFHGPGEGSGPLSQIAIDRFGENFWITEWEGRQKVKPDLFEKAAELVLKKSRGRGSVVVLARPEKGGLPEEPRLIAGAAPKDRYVVSEEGARFQIQLLGTRHPGLFLDHLPLRRWLRARVGGMQVLNTFCYTGSLSVACGLGDAAHVTSLDLSKPTIKWAEENWTTNQLAADRARFIFGDYFEWLPRLKREGKRFDCIILDPPSFSRGTKGNFSTAKDLQKLHELALDVLNADGLLVTSINSANVAIAQYQSQVLAAAKSKGRTLEVLSRIDLPETFPTRLGIDTDRYLKGWILRVGA